MAITRSIFISKPTYPFFEEIHVNLDGYFQGFALSQKRKNELALHKNFLAKYPDRKPLEISSASTTPLGNQLSAMHLKKETNQGLTTVESAFQSSRIYMDGNKQIGPFPEYLFLPGKDCKKIVKEASKGLISYRYEFEGNVFFAPAYHISLFYDYLYLNALLEPENEMAKKQLLSGKYNAFSDLATSSLNSQAKSCAIFVGLVQAGLEQEVLTYDSYLRLFRTTPSGQAISSSTFEQTQPFFNGTVKLLSPIVPATYSKNEIETYFKRYYAHLSNKKTDDGFIRPSVYEIDLSEFHCEKLLHKDIFSGIRVIGKNGCLTLPADLSGESMLHFHLPTRYLKKSCAKILLTDDEIENRIIWPTLNESHTEILDLIRQTIH